MQRRELVQGEVICRGEMEASQYTSHERVKMQTYYGQITVACILFCTTKFTVVLDRNLICQSNLAEQNNG